MPSGILIFVGWVVQLFLCFYAIRFISNTITRCILTCLPCLLLTYMVTCEVPPLLMTSMLAVTYCWLASIRLIHLTILSPNQCSTLRSFIFKFLWMFFPIVPCAPDYKEQWPIFYDLISGAVKLLVNHWMYRWLLTCPGSDSYARLIMFYIYALAFTFLSDFQSAILRTVTRDKYMLKSITNVPLISRSLREFWGRRYNQLIGTILRESVFQPALQHSSSPSVAALIVFLVSGLLHVHLAFITFGDFRDTMSTMTFFLLHGLACTIAAHTPFRLRAPVSWFLTLFFLVVTAPLQNGSFTKLGPDYYAVNKPPLIDNKWIPILSVPNFCPK
ncbi:unnamed protein product [Rotaria socialis]|uniref:Wax synthase domain-containing protein n=1 Tax=Rotaria socialis TaxID=392032 RepID=A0A818ANG8_9BILA|nr:unnamed protein product [Rotaria socialis]CAF3406642.1 unnamed protein product [Rotaria socialis]CAF3565454.1 unnamed protein product [Rotaria socialis]CAF4510628.1 unnamed protein product [Rotaria socialis]CAF4529250.1 unnamed protein product [Rotaria socialis]